MSVLSLWGRLFAIDIILPTPRNQYPAMGMQARVIRFDICSTVNLDGNFVEVYSLSPILWKLMTSYIVLGFVSFGLVLIFLDRIGARADPDRTPKQMVMQHLNQLLHHKTLRLLTPLLLFNGMQQGFIFSDYNRYFVTCALGVNYVGYCMITLGASNVLGTIFVAFFSHKIPREVVLGFGGILHISLMIGFLIWIPGNSPVLYFVLAAAWGLCDAVWQTQCNSKSAGQK
ncbi:Unc-93-like protein A [Elysia marginata]|uniref:Unc-93-like protein A n=1 Tax=Elysia marginata TaxID=1093978 RepID=A0AAV4F5B6_9GAST|nr:Unc-93-like protein A [Elysia marginata]